MNTYINDVNDDTNDIINEKQLIPMMNFPAVFNHDVPLPVPCLKKCLSLIYWYDKYLNCLSLILYVMTF